MPTSAAADGLQREGVARGPVGSSCLLRLEIILGCFQTGRMSQWAQAHFFVGRDGWRDAGASMPGVPAVEVGAGVEMGSLSAGGTGTSGRD